LPEFVVSASTTDSFKNKLDKFWSNRDLVYDYKAKLTGIGSKSLVMEKSWVMMMHQTDKEHEE